MNDFEAWEKIIVKWKQVNIMKKLNQELYDILSGAILYLHEYEKKRINSQYQIKMKLTGCYLESIFLWNR